MRWVGKQCVQDPAARSFKGPPPEIERSTLVVVAVALYNAGHGQDGLQVVVLGNTIITVHDLLSPTFPSPSPVDVD